MARPSNTDERRAQITAALVKVMAKHGYDGASVADIAKAAGLAPGLVHYHFKTKLEILLAALDGLVAAHDDRLDTALAGADDDPRSRIDAFIDAHLGLGAYADADALACWILLSGEALRERRVAHAYAGALVAITRRLERIVTIGARSGAFRCESPRAAAAAIVATIQGYFVLAATAPHLVARGSAAASTRAMASGLLQSGLLQSTPRRA